MCLARYDYIHYANMYIVHEMLVCFSVLDAFTMLVHNIRHAHVIQDMQFKRDVAYNNKNYIVICERVRSSTTCVRYLDQS